MVALCACPSDAPLERGSDATVSMPIEDFVAETHSNGVPYAAARAYGSEEVLYLTGVLRDPAQGTRWSVAVTVLAMIAEAEAVDAVIEFIARPDAAATDEYGRSQRNAVLSLGYAAHAGSATALRYLVDSLQPGVWFERGVAGAEHLPSLQEEDSIDRLLTEQALLGLALSGTDPAANAIREVQADRRLPAALRSLAAAALEEHAKVRALGLDEYDRRRYAR